MASQLSGIALRHDLIIKMMGDGGLGGDTVVNSSSMVTGIGLGVRGL